LTGRISVVIAAEIMG